MSFKVEWDWRKRWARMSLRWRLSLAFIVVSAVPVFVASFVAAKVITSSFEQNVDAWLQQTVGFISRAVDQTASEADKAVSALAATLSERLQTESEQAGLVRSFADLLESFGYDLIIVYDEDGRVHYSSGATNLTGSLPRRQVTTLMRGVRKNRPTLLMGAVRPFDGGGARKLYVLIANQLDVRFFDVVNAIPSLDVVTFVREGDNVVPLPGEGAQLSRPPVRITPALMRRIVQEGSLVDRVRPGESNTLAFATLRGEDGDVAGVVSVELTGTTALLDRFGIWAVFGGLSATAGLLSMLAGIAFAGRLTRPLNALTTGVQAISRGDFNPRVPLEGGSELMDLAAGFNTMAEQLARLSAMEVEMRTRHGLATLGEAAAVIAHEIRNPLGIIKTSSEVLRMGSGLTAQERQLVRFIGEEADRIEALVRDVLDFARPKERTVAQVDVADLVSNVLAFAAPELQRKNITFGFEASGDAHAMADRDQIHQAVLNLVLNAMEAMPEGGHIAVAVQGGVEGVEISVRDRGRGVPPEVRERIFDPFFTTKAKGTGLGLAKVRSIVADHDGTITLDSQPDQGTEFRIALPRIARRSAA